MFFDYNQKLGREDAHSGCLHLALSFHLTYSHEEKRIYCDLVQHIEIVLGNKFCKNGSIFSDVQFNHLFCFFNH
jgi:hypothetical protein